MTPTNGTAATRRPASELEIRCSAVDTISQGIPISRAVNAISGAQRAAKPRSSPRASAIGIRISAPPATLANTRPTGGSSVTAMRMNRYGMPQMTHMAANRSRALRDMNRPG